MLTEESLLIARLQDALLNSTKKQFPYFLGFLNEHQMSVVLQYIKKEKLNNYKFFGGYENSERCLLAIAGGNFEIEDYYFPVSGICFNYKIDFKLSHRDFLGALMGLGIKRESVGDILIADGYAVVFVKNEIKNYVISQIQKIGSVGVSVSLWDGTTLPMHNQFYDVNCTVSSARLDNIVSAVVPLSRDKAATAIKQGLVFINSMVIENVSHIVKEGDKISVRGKGKFVVRDFSGVTKKGRLKLTVQKYK